jgi:hypothetical protein
MISVQRVWDTVREICNKDQKGFVTPNVFNTFARVAQQNVYNEMFKELQVATALRMGGRDAGRDKSAYKMLEEDLKHYIRTATISLDSDNSYVTTYLDENGNQVGYVSPNGVVTGEVTDIEVVSAYVDDGDGSFSFGEPKDFKHLVSMTVLDSNTSVEIIRENEKTSRILNSTLSAPTLDFPVGINTGGTFQVYPSTVSGVAMIYYRQPRAWSLIDGRLDLSAYPMYISITAPNQLGDAGLDPNTAANVLYMDAQQSKNFDLPEHYLNEVVSEIVKMIGVRLRDNTLATYGLQQSQAE